MLLYCESDHDPSFHAGEAAIREAWRLLQAGSNERTFDSFLRKNPSLLTALIGAHCTGHGGIKVLSQQNVRQSVSGIQRGQVPDYLIAAKNSEGVSWWLVEMKSPTALMFSGEGRSLRLSREANQGLTRLLAYWEHCTRNQSALRDLLGVPSFAFPRGVLVLGREAEFEESEERMRLKMAWSRSSHNITVRTYDTFVRGWEDDLQSPGDSALPPSVEA